VYRVVEEETQAAIEHPVAEVLRQGRYIGQTSRLLVARDGTPIPVEDNAALIRDEQGAVLGVVLTFRDISERRQAEVEKEEMQARLFEAQKTETVSMLAGGIAHDFNNLMTSVIGYSSLALMQLDDQDALYKPLQTIKGTGERAASLTQQLLAFSRKQLLELEPLDPNALMTDLLGPLQSSVDKSVDLVTELEPDVGCVKADPAQIERVIANLVANANDAMPQGGTLTVKMERLHLAEKEAESLREARPGDFVCLSIGDTGVGMDEVTLERIFDPFFSTKTGAGGLGLSVAQGIVKQHEGWMQVLSQPGRGSTFKFYLPVVSARPKPEMEQAKPASKPPAVPARILLVEDEVGVRAVISEVLRRRGHVVVEADSAEMALKVFGQDRDFDLLLSDITLPGKSGLDLVDELLLHKPDLPVLLSSGYTDQQARWSALREKGIHFLGKPYQLSDLLSAVQRAIGTNGGRPEYEASYRRARS
jgi:signal transduction histidine kinase/CheY-like chemotaxis protein